MTKAHATDPRSGDFLSSREVARRVGIGQTALNAYARAMGIGPRGSGTDWGYGRGEAARLWEALCVREDEVALSELAAAWGETANHIAARLRARPIWSRVVRGKIVVRRAEADLLRAGYRRLAAPDGDAYADVAFKDAISYVEAHTGIGAARILDGGRSYEVCRARHALAWMLAHGGRTVAAVAWLLGRDHSTIVHALARVEADPELLELARGGMRRVDAAPVEILDRRLARFGPPIREAVRSYVADILLAGRRADMATALWGLRVIRTVPEVETAVLDALAAADLSAHAYRIALHAGAMGLAVLGRPPGRTS